MQHMEHMGNTLAAHFNLTGAPANSRDGLRLAGTSEDPQVQLLAWTGQLQQVVQTTSSQGLNISTDGHSISPKMEGESWGTT